MSYRCGICRRPSKPGEARLVWVSYRTVADESPGRTRHRQEVSAEVPVCKGCHHDLTKGANLTALLHDRGSKPATVRPKVDVSQPRMFGE